MPDHMQALTDFADQAVILPLTLAVALVLAAQGWRRGTIAWSLVVPGALAALLVLKLASYACGHLWPESGVHSPSGHAGSAAVAYAGLGVMLGLRWAAVPLAAVVALGIGASRLALGVHTLGDVVVGGMVGIAAAAVLAALAGPRPAGLARWPVAAAAAVILVLFHGQRVRAEDGIRGAAAAYIRAALPLCR